MDRLFTYPGQIRPDTAYLQDQKNAMIGLGYLAQAVLGSVTVVSGLAIGPTSPASMTVDVGIGAIYAFENVDNTPYGSLAADVTDQIVKQGINSAIVPLACPAPLTAGQSMVYLIEAAYEDVDSGLQTFTYFNSANPNQPFSGPSNLGTAQYYVRKGVCQIQAKAGIPAATGSQSAPAVDTGFVVLYTVTVAYGQTTITAANITQLASAPFITTTLGNFPTALQAQAGNYAIDTGTANAYVVAFTPVVTTLAPGQPVTFKALNANTGASTLTINGLGAISLVRIDGTALQSGDIHANMIVEGQYEAVSNTIQVQNILNGNSSALVGGPGTVFYHAGPVAPGNSIPADGSSLSRATYAALCAAITAQVTGSLTNGSATLTYTALTMSYYPQVGYYVAGPGILAGTTITATGSGSFTMSNNATATEATGTAFIMSPWPVSLTNFSIPDLRAQFIRGIDNGAGIDTSRVFGSNEADMFASHVHEVAVLGVGLAGGGGGYYTFGGSPNSYTTANGGNETRPKNVALLACIKY